MQCSRGMVHIAGIMVALGCCLRARVWAQSGVFCTSRLELGLEGCSGEKLYPSMVQNMERVVWGLWTKDGRDSLQPLKCMTTNVQCVTVLSTSGRHYGRWAAPPLETVDSVMKAFPLLADLQTWWTLALAFFLTA